MPVTNDFRAYAFDPARVDAAGKYLSRQVYWKLYAIENMLRVLVHSVLTQQINKNWWNTVDAGLQKQIVRFMAEYNTRPWHSRPGKHEIYYTFLSDINKIIASNSHLFRPIVPDIDLWVARIEQIRLPRNIVGHMNWLSDIDKKRIDVCYADLKTLIDQLKVAGRILIVP